MASGINRLRSEKKIKNFILGVQNVVCFQVCTLYI